MQNKQNQNENGRFLPIDEENTPPFSSAVYEKRYTSEKMTSRLPHSVKSLRPECSADAPCFLNAVYQNSTQMKKAQADVLQYGRSMIEMLGVLAIIGVLSVGGIAGYSKAMYRYRVNKTIDQITYMAGAIRTFFAPQKDYDGLDNVDVLKKARLVPDEMWNGDNLQDVWGNNAEIGNDCHTGAECDNGIFKAFYIIYYTIPEEACIDLLTQDWSNAGVGVIEVYNSENAEAALQTDLYVIPPVSVDKAIRLCGSAAVDTDGVERIVFHFDVDVNDSMWKPLIDATTELLNGD